MTDWEKFMARQTDKDLAALLLAALAEKHKRTEQIAEYLPSKDKAKIGVVYGKLSLYSHLSP